MIIRENHCVDCQLPCLGNACSLVNVPVVVCDVCGEHAEYRIDHQDLCERHAKEYIEEAWEGLSLLEKAQALELGGVVL